MRLKILRKERPTFETEGAVVHGSRLDIVNNDIRPPRHRSNNSFVLPTSLNTESSSLTVTPSNQTHEMITESRQQILVPSADRSTNVLPYQAIEAAYLEHGIRIRLSPTRGTPSGQLSERKSATSLQRRTPFVSRLPSRASSVLQYATTAQDQYDDSRPFSVLQHAFSGDSEQTQTVTSHKSNSQSSQINQEIYPVPHMISTPVNPQSDLVNNNALELVSSRNVITSSNELLNKDPDLLYMSSLLQKPSGESVRESIRRRAGLRGTFAVHRNPLIINSIQPQQQTREKSPATNRTSVSRNATIAVIPMASPQKIDQDILKHASRIRRTSQSKEPLIKSPRMNSSPENSSPTRTNAMSIASSPTRTNTMSIASSPLRANHDIDYYKRTTTSTKRSSKSFTLEPIEFIMSSAQHSKSLSRNELPMIKASSATNDVKNPVRRTKSAKTAVVQSSNSTYVPIRENSASSSILREDSFLSIKTSTSNVPRQSNSFDSGCYDRSSSIGDVQSLTSSSLVQITSSVPSARLNSSAARRPNTNKKVSFYDDSTAVIVTTATYV